MLRIPVAEAAFGALSCGVPPASAVRPAALQSILQRTSMLVLRSSRVASVVLLVASLTACKEAVDPVRASSIAGMNAVDSVRLGKTFTFVVETRDDNGNRVTGRRITWSSLNPTTAAVDANGVVTGVALGSTIITARVDGIAAATQMVVQPSVTTVLLLPPTNTIPVGSSKTLTIALGDKDNQAVG